ncbi:MutS domain V protein, partial [Bacteriovorax sp. DB6_IX]|uniref:MutS-related protein n=1 Tax=Bacteriovorax sp. DB6_IX TaxID=1353530 RepID=UPI000389FBD5
MKRLRRCSQELYNSEKFKFMANNILFQTLNNIDWQQIANQITFHSYFEDTKDIFTNNPQVFTETNINSHLDNISTLSRLLDDGINFDLILFDCVSDAAENHTFIKNMNKGLIGDFKQLNFVSCIIENIFELKKSLPHGEQKDIILELINDGQRLRNKFIKPLRTFVDRNGSVYLERHPKLAKKIAERNALETKIREKVMSTLKDADIEKRLQFQGYDVINDRYVIPVRSDSYNANIGLIISRSGTGHTLFVEPTEVRELCNKRLKIISEIDEIVNEICHGYSTLLSENYDYVQRVYKLILKYDYDLTQAKYSIHKGLVRPEVSLERDIKLSAFFHPLIDGCIANNIEISSDKHGLIISGPNTGGKTVSIKTIILCHVFLKLGFFIPAVEARLPLLNDIFYFDSDYQDLSHGLSSFAGETTAILEMLENINDNSLIAADEIFNSTSSDEASSLAISIISYLTDVKDSKVLISTHHQLLKTKMQTNEKFISAHVGYDFETNKPNYRLIIGTPGSSMALTIFEKLSSKFNIDPSIIENAKSILDQKYMTYEKLLQDLSHKKADLDKLLVENRDLNSQLKNQKKSMEGVLYLEKQKAFEIYKTKLEKQLDKINSLRRSDMSPKQMQKKASEFKS